MVCCFDRTISVLFFVNIHQDVVFCNLQCRQQEQLNDMLCLEQSHYIQSSTIKIISD
jgi:hypothetical protein